MGSDIRVSYLVLWLTVCKAHWSCISALVRHCLGRRTDHVVRTLGWIGCGNACLIGLFVWGHKDNLGSFLFQWLHWIHGISWGYLKFAGLHHEFTTWPISTRPVVLRLPSYTRIPVSPGRDLLCKSKVLKTFKTESFVRNNRCDSFKHFEYGG